MTEKTSRLAFRLNERQEALIRAAAASRGQSMTDYVINSVCEQAEQTILDRTLVVLSSDAFDAFVREGDEPARDMPDVVATYVRNVG